MNAPGNKGMLRWIAVFTMAVWFSAQFLCAAHCAMGPDRASSLKSSHCCKKSDQKPVDTDRGASGTCIAFKNLAAAIADASVAVPAPDWAFTIAFVIASIDPLQAVPIQSSNRPASPPRTIVAPEVSLGHDARSHAPPAIA